jgi:hypothetical protein
VAKKRTQVEEMMEQINSQNPQGVVRGVPRATCPLFGDKKEQQMFCFYETSHIHDPNGPSKCDVKRHEHASEHVRQQMIGGVTTGTLNMHQFPSTSAAGGRERL